MAKDSRGNSYLDIANARFTYVPSSRKHSGDFKDKNVIRIQSYTGKGRRLNQGAEIPIDGILDTIKGIFKRKK